MILNYAKTEYGNFFNLTEYDLLIRDDEGVVVVELTPFADPVDYKYGSFRLQYCDDYAENYVSSLNIPCVRADVDYDPMSKIELLTSHFDVIIVMPNILKFMIRVVGYEKLDKFYAIDMLRSRYDYYTYKLEVCGFVKII